MKSLRYTPLLLAMVLMQSCIVGNWNNGISGNGDVESEVLDIDGFTGVHASAGIDVTITQGDFHVELVADDNLHEYITVEKEGKMLKVGTKKNIYRADSKIVHVSLPELTDIKISSAGDIDAKSDFECKDLNISISSAGDLNLGVDAESIDLSISSSGDCDLWGSTEVFDVRLSSAGDLNAYDLDADYVSVKVSSAGDAAVTAHKEVDAEASSAGNIYIKGDAKVLRSKESSAGNIRHK